VKGLDPRVSVVVPLYNKVNHIKRALDSVLAQTYRDFEVVVVNDGSTDGSEKVVEQYTDPRIRLVHQENAGVSAARNRGIGEARADLIAFLDADDEWLSEHLAAIRRLAQNYPGCGIYATAYEEIDEPRTRRHREYDGIPASPWEGVIANYFRSTPVWTSASAVPRHVFDSERFFPVGVHSGEDLVVWCRIALRYPVAFSGQVSAVYHLEAENRANLSRSVLGEPEEISSIDAAIAAGQLPAGITPTDLVEYKNARLIERALRNVGHGHRREARALLHKVQATRTHRRLIRRWLLLSYLPAPLLRLALRVRQSIF
jgi:glycosyltransferase involved in cell wall biosynthesis